MPAIFASKQAPTVPDENIKLSPVLSPTLIPDTTRSGFDEQAWYIPQLVASAGVPTIEYA